MQARNMVITAIFAALGAAGDLRVGSLRMTIICPSGLTIYTDTLILYPEVSWNQALNGTEQTRSFEVKGDRFQIKTPVLVSPVSGKQTVATIVYERVK
jgi:hypothetical protein